MKLYQKAKDAYDNLKIQTKFTLCILFAVSIPLLSIAVLFSDRLYDMVIADTIRNEQNATMQIGPKIEDTLNEVIDFHEFVTALRYYQTLFYQPVSTSLAKLAATKDALDFADQIKNKTAESAVTAVRIYLDIPGQSVFYENPSAKDLFLPVSRAKGTYWYGIFQGSSVSVLHCPSFYLGNREKTELGDLALITETWLYYQGTSYPCYTASITLQNRFTGYCRTRRLRAAAYLISSTTEKPLSPQQTTISPRSTVFPMTISVIL